MEVIGILTETGALPVLEGPERVPVRVARAALVGYVADHGSVLCRVLNTWSR